MTDSDALIESEPGGQAAREPRDERASAGRLRVRVLLFGAAREAAGREELPLEVAAPASAASVLDALVSAVPALSRFGRSLLVAVNEEYAQPSREVRAGDDVAIFPPVSGGAQKSDAATDAAPDDATDAVPVAAPDRSLAGASGDATSGDAADESRGDAADAVSEAARDFFELTTEPIDVGAVARRVVPPRCGATVTLDGYVREWTRGRRTLHLVYEAYPPMALAEMRRLGAAARERFDIAHVGIVHRTGRLEIGETSVVISVAAPHRRAAFEACEWAIRELKRTVPIWKKEFYEGGEVWIEGEGAPP